uniref:Uncharacterized protein n=1 Tax=Fagus sylvatica TaxID=28930 RepID=A0A2N9J7Z0_FAGSY
MEDNTLCGKRRKGGFVGLNQNGLGRITQTTGSGSESDFRKKSMSLLISQEYHPAVCAVISGAEDVGVSSSQFDDFSVAATSTCKARELKVC